MQSLKKGLDATSLRQEVISNNIANINTPGFKRSEVVFEDKLKKALNEEDVSLDNLDPKAEKNTTTIMRNDINNVDANIEMLNLSSNQLKHSGLTQVLNNYYANNRYVINEGRM